MGGKGGGKKKGEKWLGAHRPWRSYPSSFLPGGHGSVSPPGEQLSEPQSSRWGPSESRGEARVLPFPGPAPTPMWAGVREGLQQPAPWAQSTSGKVGLILPGSRTLDSALGTVPISVDNCR